MNDLDKRYYKISEVAEIVGLPVSTLRFWENKFTIIRPRRNEHGTRFYTPTDIEKIRMVYYLVKEKGMKLEAAQDQIKRNAKGISHKVEAIERLKSVRNKLQALIDSIDTRQD
jgi:DNA-binding transcriptional MerR regulator